MGIKPLRKIQLGLEATKGTAVPATTIWRGLGTLEDQLEVVEVEEDVGYASGTDRTHVAKKWGVLPMEAVPATFEQFPYVLSAGVKDVVTGVADGVGTGKIYAYPFPTTSLNTTKAYTIEAGDDQAVDEMAYCFVRSFGLTGGGGEALNMASEWVGREPASSSFTGAISLPTVEDILFSKGSLYIDAIGGTIGTTQVSNTFNSLDMSVITGWIPWWTGDANRLDFAMAKPTRPLPTIGIEFEHDAVGAARRVDWRAQTPRLIRIEFEGSALGTPGTAYTYKTLRIDFASKIYGLTKLGEREGNNILTATFLPRYNTTAAIFLEITVVNELVSLP